MKAKPEQYVFVACSFGGIDIWEPDFLASVDVNPESPNYSKVVGRTAMPIVGDEVFWFGWNVCSSSHKTPSNRMYVLLPGLRSGRINVVNVEVPERLWMHKTIEPTTILDETGCTVPCAVRPLPNGDILVSTLAGQSSFDTRTLPKGPGLFLLDADFKVKKRWDRADPHHCMDFWYQTGPKQPVLVSTPFAGPRTLMKGFDPRALEGKNGFGRYGAGVYVWNWNDPSDEPRYISFKDNGHGPLPVRFLHNPTLRQAYVAAVISGTVWLIVDGSRERPDTPFLFNHYAALKVIEVEPVKVDGKDIRAMTTDLVISMDDKFLYLSNWLHGDVRQYDITDRGKPKLTGQIFLAGLLGKGVKHGDKKLWGGPQSLQLSLDGKRLYVTSSFFTGWDNQFYPEMAERGSWMVQLDCDTQKGGLTLNEKFFVHFGREFGGTHPSRARAMHLDTGDCTSDIFV
ncbi:selenium-binding protein : Selenium-binding protein OS=Gloeocapsa sp. PCC 7428 GN=Glo7428_4019 PE=4 SV=1: SBP56 [Gemmataceae bacterium]|nr:selenium-binding protein : Selenium-binding protein OS=Gloeocapsa sp. PCC 7428 GN=Glo7428_4019 PE=4 SV=1: SBP56 [Gemmataceae bacterium]VTU00517.1 selenium-binding protein : Selenium-binding protein OS=Gloeocapsa sp. PCC 7428 GN=Glo7428_4019 PE=4 SV=1: SBP56 [Gemmataceae bacterium]